MKMIKSIKSIKSSWNDTDLMIWYLGMDVEDGSLVLASGWSPSSGLCQTCSWEPREWSQYPNISSILDNFMIILVSFSLSPATSWGRHLNNINQQIFFKRFLDISLAIGYHCLSLSRFCPFLQILRDPCRIGVFFTALKDDTASLHHLPLLWRLHELKTSRGSVPRRWRSVPCAACCAKRPRRKKTTSRSWKKPCCSFETCLKITVEVLFRVRCFVFFVLRYLRCWVLEDTELSAFQPCQPFHGAESYYEWLRQVPQRVL